MKPTKTICVSLLLLAGTLTGARGDDYRTDINPALLYYQAFLFEANGQEHSQYLITNTWDFGEHLPDQFGSAVSNFNAELEFVREAGQQMAPCDWGTDLSRHGVETLLPYLGATKQAVIASQFQIMWDLQNGNEAEARDDLVADLAAGRHASTTRVLIAALVEIAIENQVCTMFAQNFNHFSPETLQQIEDGFAAAPPRGTIAECEPTFEVINRWLLSHLADIQKQYAGDNDGAMDALRHLFYYDASDWERLTNRSGGTIGGFIQDVRDTEELYPKLATLMALPYHEYNEQLPSYQAEFEQSGNAYFLHAWPPWEAARRREFAVEVRLAMARAAIEYKLRGDAGLKSVMDPCGNGPFTMKRFYLNGVDRGFELQSPLNRGNGPERVIFVEHSGPPFAVMGDKAGQPFSHKQGQ